LHSAPEPTEHDCILMPQPVVAALGTSRPLAIPEPLFLAELSPPVAAIVLGDSLPTDMPSPPAPSQPSRYLLLRVLRI
jgi:hypothetical protein